jgi:DNA-binding NtrC family response regulator
MRYSVGSLVCRSEPMMRVLEQIKLARSSRVPVYLEGEDGTGKEHIARTIHGESEESAGSFVPLDCRRMRAIDLKLAIRRLLKAEPDDVIDPVPISRFEPRTLYLSHVEQLPRDLQEMLVEALRPDRNGSQTPLRFMASSTVELQSALRDETIRSDFFYLATAVRIELPPLRGRADDLDLLAQSMLEELNRIAEKQVAGFTEEVWSRFRQYNWPGNLDELAAVVREARDACAGDSIRIGHLPFRFRAGLDAQAVGPKRAPAIPPLDKLLHDAETEHIRHALEQSGHNKSKAARLLGMPRAKLYRRMKTLGIADLEEE